MSFCAMTICFTGFVVVIQPDIFILANNFTFLATVLNHTFVLCWFGGKIETESSSIATTIYDSKLFDNSKEMQKDFLLVMAKAQRAQSMTATSFFKRELPGFMAILKRSYSYFTLLRQAYGFK